MHLLKYIIETGVYELIVPLMKMTLKSLLANTRQQSVKKSNRNPLELTSQGQVAT